MTIYNTPRKNAPPGNMVIVRFCVEADELQPGDSIQVVGSCEDLGLWDPAHALMLTPDKQNPKRWTGFIETSEETIKFRYFISYMLTGDEGDRMVISLWESFLLPRCVLTRVEQKDGECRNSQTDLFGFYAGRRLVSEGWLQHEEENQILLRVHGNSLKYYKKGQTGAGRLRVTPLDVRRRTAFSGTVDDDEHEEEDIEHYNYDSHSSTTVGNLSSSTPRFASQPADGCMFLNGSDYLVFKTHSVAVEHLAFYIEVIDADGKKASCYALPSSLNDTFGLTSLPFITKSGRPVGQLSVEYLFVRSLHRPHPRQTMETSFSRHWKKRTTLEVGHRGMGNSYTKFAAARENTIHSLNSAAENGADFVEFDVQLTKDKVAVIYHDFHVLVSVAKRVPEMVDLSLLDDHADSSLNYHEMAVKDLKLKQCKLLMLDHCAVSKPKSDVEVKKLVGDSCEADDLKPFPTLLEALNKVNSDVGFNVEVKYPMMQNDGIHECSNYFERNEFVDIILADVLNNAGGRRIMFSSFDPDICSLIAMKQNRYPVLFLCIGETERYTPFKDQRSSTSLTAVHFAAGAGILGVNFHSEDLLKDARPVKKATDFGLVSFVWGDDLNHRENIPYFKKELCVDGIIYDRIGEEERRQNVFLVEREQKRALFLVNSGANTPVRPGSPQLPPSPPRSASKEAPDSPPSGPPSPIRRVASLAHDMPRVQITQS